MSRSSGYAAFPSHEHSRGAERATPCESNVENNQALDPARRVLTVKHSQQAAHRDTFDRTGNTRPPLAARVWRPPAPAQQSLRYPLKGEIKRPCSPLQLAL